MKTKERNEVEYTVVKIDDDDMCFPPRKKSWTTGLGLEYYFSS